MTDPSPDRASRPSADEQGEPVDAVREGEPPPTESPVDAETTPAAEARTVEPDDRAEPPASQAASDARPAAPAGPGRAARSSPEDDIVWLRDVSRAFDDRVVVRDMDLTVHRGKILGIIGPSGSGKTTTIRMVTGALRPTKGRIRVLGEEPTRFHRATREQIGYMPQLFTLYPDLSARENVDFVASMFGLLWPRRRRRTKQVLKLLELWDARGRRASRMSGGMQRRLELACALVHEPTLLILDEPTAGIDPLLRVTIWEELHRLRDAGRTLLLTTQLVSEAEECDEVALIARGRVIAMDTPDNLRRTATGGELISVETANVVDGSTVERLPGVLGVRQRGPRELEITVEDAATGLPAVVDALGAAGVDVAAAQEIRPSFDDVFAALVHRAAADDEANGIRAEEDAA